MAEPQRLPNSFNPLESTLPLSIRITHFAATPLHQNHSTAHTAPRPTNKISFELHLPQIPLQTNDPAILGPPPAITHLEFSPCARYLLAVTAHESVDDTLSLFESATGQIDQWSLVWTESLARFGSIVIGGKHVVKIRWLAEKKKWYPTPSTSTNKKPLFVAPTRSPALTGASFILVLSCASLLFVHIPPSTPLVPLVVLLPLSANMSLHALPTPPHAVLSSNPLSPTSPQNDIDDLVANLVDGPPISISTSLGLDITASSSVVDLGGIGVGAMRDQLEAAAVTGTSEAERRVVGLAAIGSVRGERGSIERNESTFLLAWTSLPVDVAALSSDQAVETIEVLGSVKAMPIAVRENEMDENGDFGMADFTELDQAFGGASASRQSSLPPTASGLSKGKAKAVETDEKIEMCELRVCSNAEGGPRLSVRALPPIFLTDPTDTNSAQDTLTHLEWLEDVVLPEGENTEASADLRLLAVLSSRDVSPRSSLLISWAAANEPYQLSDAFSNLEGKKTDVTAGEKDWAMRRVISKTIESGLITAVSPRSGPGFSSFVSVMSTVALDGVVSSSLAVFDSATLESVDEYGTISLPASRTFSSMQVSPSRALICAIDSITGQPTLAAAPLGKDEVLLRNLGVHIAIAILRQLDTSDLVGRVVGLKDETATMAVMRVTRDTLQLMLAPGRRLDSTPLQMELLGISQVLFKASPGLYLRGTISYDMIQLAAMVRAFKIAENRERGSDAFRCDGDSVLPLVAYAGWYAEFCTTLVKDILADTVVSPTGVSPSPTPRRILLLHPLPRSLLLSSITSLLSLQQFITTLGERINPALRLSRSILDDTIDYCGLSLREWSSVLVGLNEVAISEEARDEMMLTMGLGEGEEAVGRILLALLSSGTLRTATLPTPPTTPPSTDLDLINKSRLSSASSSPKNGESLFKGCTKCGERTGRRDTGKDTGKWGLFESGWRARCACGGMWIGI